MKIYFAGSIRGGREDAHFYAEIITFLKHYGTVLTEHVGEPSLTTAGDEGITDRQIHDRDLAWLREADLIVAEVTVPSLGVGYELGRAFEQGKKVIGLYRPQPEKRLSAMIRGCAGIKLVEYQKIDELKEELGKVICNMNQLIRIEVDQ